MSELTPALSPTLFCDTLGVADEVVPTEEEETEAAAAASAILLSAAAARFSRSSACFLFSSS